MRAKARFVESLPNRKSGRTSSVIPSQVSVQHTRHAGRFSFNVAKGRCEQCEGEGFVCVELLFLPSGEMGMFMRRHSELLVDCLEQ